MLKYCTKCWYPHTKPDLTFNEEGVCSSCTAFEARKTIDWDARRELFIDYMDKRSTGNIRNSSMYDCIVPVSGGKDSHYQLIKMRKLGYRPLAVNATTCDLSSLGRVNLDNIRNMGFDLIEIGPNTQLRRKINKYCLETIGDISWPEHVLIFTIPVIIACKFGINTIIWGENPQNEYGGPIENQDVFKMEPNRWLAEFGGLNGLRVNDLIDNGIGDTGDYRLYRYPTMEDISYNNIEQIFLGQFFEWDGRENFAIAHNHGFTPSVSDVETHGFCHENLDNYQTGIHDYFKYLKYGFGRATDICCTEIKQGRMTREYAKFHIRQWDGTHIRSYLQKQTIDILAKINISETEFIKICDKFMNKELFYFDENGLIMPKFRPEWD